MKLLGITDLHGNQSALRRILADAGPVDVVLLGGDITNFGTPHEAERLLQTAQDSGAAVLAVAGNCDSPQIENRLVELGASLYRRGVVHGQVGFHGLSGMPPWHQKMYQFTEKEMAEALQAGFPQIAGAQHHVILSHPPPRNERIDRTQRGDHVGSTALAHLYRPNPAAVGRLRPYPRRARDRAPRPHDRRQLRAGSRWVLCPSHARRAVEHRAARVLRLTCLAGSGKAPSFVGENLRVRFDFLSVR